MHDVKILTIYLQLDQLQALKGQFTSTVQNVILLKEESLTVFYVLKIEMFSKSFNMGCSRLDLREKIVGDGTLEMSSL